MLESHQVVASPQMLAELVDVLSREKFIGVDRRQTRLYLSILVRKAVVANAGRSFSAVPEDPDDDVVLSTAYVGKASHIVSGDRHLLNIGQFRGIRIVTVNEMLGLLRR